MLPLKGDLFLGSDSCTHGKWRYKRNPLSGLGCSRIKERECDFLVELFHSTSLPHLESPYICVCVNFSYEKRRHMCVCVCKIFPTKGEVLVQKTMCVSLICKNFSNLRRRYSENNFALLFEVGPKHQKE